MLACQTWQIWKSLWQCGCIWNHKFFLRWLFPARWTLADCHQDRFLLPTWNMIISAKIFCQPLIFLVLCLSQCVNILICIKVRYSLEFLKSTLSRKGFPDSVFTEHKSSLLVGSWFLLQFPDWQSLFPLFFSLSESSVCLWLISLTKFL